MESRGIEVCSLESAQQMAQRMTEIVLPDYPFETGDEVAVMVSGLGATPVMELYVLYGEIAKLLEEKAFRFIVLMWAIYFTSTGYDGGNPDCDETG